MIVVSPLNALMMDQIGKLKRYLNVGVLSTPQAHRAQQIIFAHPEALIDDKFVFKSLLKSKAYQHRVKAIVVDEAHLVEEW